MQVKKNFKLGMILTILGLFSYLLLSSFLKENVDSQSATPWIMSMNAPISANGGFRNFSVPSTVITIPYGDGTYESYLSNTLAISGNGSMIPSRISSKGTYAINYYNKATTNSSGSANWYSHLLSQAQQSGQTIVTSSVSSISGNVSSNMGVAAGSQNIWSINGNLTVSSGTICDVKGAFFINGDLNIEPNFLNSGFTSGCIFITSGNTNVISVGTTTQTACNNNIDFLIAGDGSASIDDALDDLVSATNSFIDTLDTTKHRVAVIDQTFWATGFASGENFASSQAEKEALKTRYPPYFSNGLPRCGADQIALGKCSLPGIADGIVKFYNDHPRTDGKTAKKVLIKMDDADGEQIALTGQQCYSSIVNSEYIKWKNLYNEMDVYFIQFITNESCGDGICGEGTNLLGNYVKSFASSKDKFFQICPDSYSDEVFLNIFTTILEEQCGGGANILEAFLISNGSFNTFPDTIEPIDKPEVLVHGGVFSQNVSLTRDLEDQNSTLPAHIFSYDPRYKEFFRSIFSSLNYSIREVID